MSASREKKMRQNTANKETAVSASQKTGKVWKTIIAIVLVVAIIAATAFFSLLNSGSLNASLTAVTVDNHTVSPGLLNYFYSEARQQMMSEMGSLYSMVFSSETPLSQQPFVNESYASWGDYVLDVAIKNATEMFRLCDDAEKNGFTLSEETRATIDDEIATVEAMVMYYGYGSADAYIASTFGAGSNLDNYREYLTLRLTAGEYVSSKLDSMQYSADEIDTYYTENKDDYYAVSYQQFSITPNMLDEGATAEDCEAAAKEMAEAVVDTANFNELAKGFVEEDSQKYYDSGAITYRREYTMAEADAECRDWLFADERQPGDTTVIPYETEEESGAHVLHFVEKSDLNYNVVNFHQIVIDTTSTNEEILAVAEEEAQAILDQYLEGEEQTEEAFLALINSQTEKSTYTGTYENTPHGALENEYDQWLFSADRKPGDTAVVKSEMGYHVMYFSGTGDTYYNYSVTEDMREGDYNEWLSAITADAQVVTHNFPMGLVNKY